MNCSDYKRARRPEQKKERMLEITDTVDAMFHEDTYHEITLTTIAERMGMSRGNLYKYFDTVEDIFMSLYLQKQCKCMTDIMNLFFECDTDGEEICPENDFERYECKHLVYNRMSMEDFAGRVAHVFVENADIFKYHDLLGCIIETNVPVEKLAEFKKNMACMKSPLTLAIKKQCPNASDKRITLFLKSIMYQGCGLYNQSHQCPKVAKAIRLAGLTTEEIDFEAELKRFILSEMNQIENV
ncbi:MAG: TetR/AcrR family transcriptional regulator [Lachnospiraceae bacterium]|nr:TetR/AcrR family transcriptional regulator [Lachnospiraceae bacterium]